ncbi:MAG: AAA family ATPase [Acidimicrobiales bacterium]
MVLPSGGPATERGLPHECPTGTLFDERPVAITGMSGTGKSTVLAELAQRGLRVVDTDDPGWITCVESPDGPEPMWDLNRIGTLLDGHGAGWLFVSGCVAYQGAVYDRFDAVVLRDQRGGSGSSRPCRRWSSAVPERRWASFPRR